MHLLGIREEAESYEEMPTGKQLHKRYSERAQRVIREAKAAGR